MAATIEGAGELAGAIGVLGKKAVQAVTESLADNSADIAEKNFEALGKESINDDIVSNTKAVDSAAENMIEESPSKLVDASDETIVKTSDCTEDASRVLNEGAGNADNLPVLHSDQVIINNYQRYYSEAWSQVVNDFNKGNITIPAEMNWKTVLGQHTDAIARNRLINFLRREGILEGPQTDVLVNRWLRDPSGSGKYRIPDVRLKTTGTILDGTIGNKTMASPQIQDFIQFSGGDDVIIIRP